MTTDVLYEAGEGIARLTLNRPARGNGLTRGLITRLAELVEEADLDAEVRVLLLAGNGTGFCGGYDLVDSAEQLGDRGATGVVAGAPTDPAVMAANHDPAGTW